MGIYKAGTEYSRVELDTGREVQPLVILLHRHNLVRAILEALNGQEWSWLKPLRSQEIVRGYPS